jgi:hypothetical protein
MLALAIPRRQINGISITKSTIPNMKKILVLAVAAVTATANANIVINEIMQSNVNVPKSARLFILF